MRLCKCGGTPRGLSPFCLECLRANLGKRRARPSASATPPVEPAAPLLVFGERSPPSPNPQPYYDSPLDMAEQRRLYCSYYERCLDTADAACWPGFTCASCDVRSELPIPDRVVEDTKIVASLSMAPERACADCGLPIPGESPRHQRYCDRTQCQRARWRAQKKKSRQESQ